MNPAHVKKILSIIFCFSFVLGVAGCNPQNGTEILEYEEFCAAKEVMDTYTRQAYEVTKADMSSNQPIIDAYNFSKFQKPFDNYSEEELNKAYQIYQKTASAAESNGFASSEYLSTAKQLTTSSLSDEYEGMYGLNDAEVEYRANIKRNSEHIGMSEEDFIEKILVPYVLVQNFATQFLQKYYFENIYDGLYKQMLKEYQSLWKGNDPYTSEAIAYSSTDEYQNAYVDFLKDYEKFVESSGN